jgi:hypothetical protein
MGTWEQVITMAQREQFRELLANSNPIYTATTMDTMDRLLGRRRGRAYIYTPAANGAPVYFRILLLVTPDRNDADVVKVVNAVPIGDYDPRAAAILIGRQVRSIMDEIGATSCYGHPLKDYGDAKMNEFFRVMPELLWEMGPEEASTNGKVRFRFKRTPARRAEDELFEGPTVNCDSASPRSGDAN